MGLPRCNADGMRSASLLVLAGWGLLLLLRADAPEPPEVASCCGMSRRTWTSTSMIIFSLLCCRGVMFWNSAASSPTTLAAFELCAAAI